jgi:predicted porin
LAIAAAAGLFTGGIALAPAQAADLGGDCCADLEERVAELEATTVRKGNRKVSVKLSGQVNRAILWWDDGEDNDVYFVDNEQSSSRFRITGSATISPGRTAGFRIEADWFIQNNSSAVSNCRGDSRTNGDTQCTALANTVGNSVSQVTGTASTAGVTDMRWTEVWIKDDSLGKLSLGKGDTASNGTSEVDLSGTSVAQYSGMADVGGNFVFRTSGGVYTSITLGNVYSQLDGLSRQNRIRYDTPSFGGFTLSTSYGADDFWDGALRFKKEWNSVRCAWAGAVAHDTQEKDDDFWRYSTSGSCIHTPSGLNLTLGYAQDDEGSSSDRDQQWWFVKLGISRRWNSHGKTSISVQYAENQDAVSSGDETQSWGVAFVQNIDSAALELYLAYSHHEYDDNSTTGYDDLQFFLAGARIKF